MNRVERELDQLAAQLESVAIRGKPDLAMAYLDHQRPVFECKTQNIVLVKGRRVGGTVGAFIWLLPHAIRGGSALWVDVGYRQIMRYYNRYVRRMLKKLPPKSYAWNQQLLQLSFASGGYVDFGSKENAEAMEGEDYQRIVINEAGFTLRDESLYYNTILPMTMHIGGCRQLIVGTPKGANKLFKKLYLLGQDPLVKDWASFTLDSWTNPLTKKAELEAYSRRMPRQVYEQEILGKFIDEGGLYFENLENLFAAGIPTEPDPSGIYVIGVDLGKKHDFTAAWVGYLQTRKGVKCVRFNKMRWPDTCARLVALSAQYNGARLVLDATGLGDVVLDDLRARGLNVTPIVFTNAVKGELIGNLNVDIAWGRLQCVPDDVTKGEMQIFEQTVLPSGALRLEAPGNEHDDCVMALALMNHGLGRPDSGDVVIVRRGFAEEYPVDFGERL